MPSNATLSKEVQQEEESICNEESRHQASSDLGEVHSGGKKWQKIFLQPVFIIYLFTRF